MEIGADEVDSLYLNRESVVKYNFIFYYQQNKYEWVLRLTMKFENVKSPTLETSEFKNLK